MAGRYSLDQSIGQKRSWTAAHEMIPDSQSSQSKRVHRPEIPMWQNQCDLSQSASLYTIGYGDRLSPYGHIRYGLLTPELSITDCDTVKIGSTGNPAINNAIDPSWVNNVYMDPISSSENGDIMAEEVCFGMVCSLSNFIFEPVH